ncbi:rhodopsin, GQ-coupled-like [Biomphalaria glabrata]|uniref:Rhodopsin, GQ-coupled-like n=1 Tax=Biomphalaria glabrata TaxID=6526 RepID=A0A9W3AID5_BIOGL|nr:rhodopsin, GQ-coupled-like [Biomphalaria glabrata]
MAYGNINFSTSTANLTVDSDCFHLNLATLIFNVLEIVFLVIINLTTSLSFMINTFALFAILQTKKLRNYKTSFVISQVVADIIFQLAMTLINLIQPNLATPLIFNFVGIFCKNISFSLMLCISVEKYILLLHPVVYQRLVTKVKMYVVVSAVWVLSFILSNPFQMCSFFALSFSSYGKKYHQYVFPVINCLGLSVLTFICIHIFVITRRHLNQIARLKHFITDSCTYRQNQNDFNKRRMKTISFFMTVFINYLFLLTPVMAAKCYIMIHNFFRSDDYYQLFFTVQLLESLSSLFNVYMYTWKYPGFKKAARHQYTRVYNRVSGCLVFIYCGPKVERNATVILEMQRLNR